MKELYFFGIIAVLLLASNVNAYDNISIYDYGANYIVWDTGDNTGVWIDGIDTDVKGGKYGQYDLQPGTEHIACNYDGNCTGITTKLDSWYIMSQWGIYFILIGLCVVSYYIPITSFPAVVYSMYLLTVYLPGNTNGDFFQYSLVVILMIVSILAAMVGWRKL